MRLMMLVSTIPDADRTRVNLEVFARDAKPGQPPVYRFASSLSWSPDVPADKVLAYTYYVVKALGDALDHELENDGMSLYSESITRQDTAPTPTSSRRPPTQSPGGLEPDA